MNNFVNFLESAPTAWHAAHLIAARLQKEGFIPLHEGDAWKLKSGGSYFLVRDGSLVAAFRLPKKTPHSLRLLASHLDSPALKIRPHPQRSSSGIERLSTEIYGAPILASWLNRDLVIAGRVTSLNKQGQLDTQLVHLKETPLIIPQLALHLDRSEAGPTILKQEHLQAIASIAGVEHILPSLLRKQIAFDQLLSFDLFFVPLEAPRPLGSERELLAAYRLDNLTSAYASLLALLSAPQTTNTIQMALFWDHEEVGSRTYLGAESLFVDQILERIALYLKIDLEELYQLKSRSLCISVDLAHGFNPAYPDKYDVAHAPLLGQGVVHKHNAGQKYATSSSSAIEILQIAKKRKIPIQDFVSRSDIPSGSTVGPIMAARCGIPTVDLGIAGWAMHSAREVIAWRDEEYLRNLLEAVLS